MLEIPKRLSLTSQTAAAIRKGIDENHWDEYLPGERRLSDLFEVSRPTVRAALHILEKEGLLRVQQGKRSRVPVKSVRRQGGSPKCVVGLVTLVPSSNFSLEVYRLISEMRAHLSKSGIATEVIVCNSQSPRFLEQKLVPLLQQHHIFCSVLLSVGFELQQWFSKKSIPALVLGTCYPSVQLPSLDIDHRSVCRHAANILMSRGHRRIAYVTPNSRIAGLLVSEQGFCEAAEKQSASGIHATILRHDGTARNIMVRLESLFSSNERPTALLVARTQDVLVTMFYLLNRGFKVPETVSLIARDGSLLFESVPPLITHYSFDVDSIIRRLSRLMSQMVDQRYLPPKRHLIFPRFIAGSTIRDLTRSAGSESSGIFRQGR